jgi:hypothetical protein
VSGKPLQAPIVDEHYLPCAVANQPDTDKHLPECALTTGLYDDRADCVCDALRSCELRVRTENGTGVTQELGH